MPGDVVAGVAAVSRRIRAGAAEFDQHSQRIDPRRTDETDAAIGPQAPRTASMPWLCWFRFGGRSYSLQALEDSAILVTVAKLP